ncbi:hypothetical protein DFQ28_000098 [Apophysomyces sp. BC1034]|nr:hypothetical protein DFQ30_006674 [Apophysomyces sp. BC1015]KAG0183228.1 hypothetical protein DFQ29_008588 [Apophysomyces sp. BC1021]KAG0194400.1 hypothetical protein DFQ28_000098 [Apophysomyces sp. BC1034]
MEDILKRSATIAHSLTGRPSIASSHPQGWDSLDVRVCEPDHEELHEPDMTNWAETEPSPLELQALRVAVLKEQKSSKANEQLVAEEQQEEQELGQENIAMDSYLSLDSHAYDIEPQDWIKLRKAVLEKGSYAQYVAQSARLVDQTYGSSKKADSGRSTPISNRRESACRGIRSALMNYEMAKEATIPEEPDIKSLQEMETNKEGKHWKFRRFGKRRKFKDRWKQTYIVPNIHKIAMSSPSRRTSKTSTLSMGVVSQEKQEAELEERVRLTFAIADYLQKQAFMRKLSQCLLRYGCPSHRVQTVIRRMATVIDVDLSFVFMPNVVLLNFIDKDAHTTETYFVGEMQGFDMQRLNEIYRLDQLLLGNKVTVNEALAYLNLVADRPEYIPMWIRSASYAVGGFASAIIFYGGGWKEAGVAAALALFLAAYEVLSIVWKGLGPLFDVTACIVIGFLATAAGHSQICFVPTAFGAVVMLLPGWAMTSAIIELASRNLISGIIRLVYALLYSYILAYGLTTGQGLYLTIDKSIGLYNPSDCATNVSQWWYFLLVPMFCIVFCIYIRAFPSRWPRMTAVACAGFATSYALSHWTHTTNQVIQLVPAFLVGLIGNLYTRFTENLSFDAILLGAFMLVPGSVGLRSGLAFASEGAAGGEGAVFALAMIEAAIGIIIGLYLSTLLVFPFGKQSAALGSF